LLLLPPLLLHCRTVWTALHTYLQLQENIAGPFNYTGGWDFYKRLLARYQVLAGTDAVSTDDKKLQTWVSLSHRCDSTRCNDSRDIQTPCELIESCKTGCIL
jgi:hypothetical protein